MQTIGNGKAERGLGAENTGQHFSRYSRGSVDRCRGGGSELDINHRAVRLAG